MSGPPVVLLTGASSGIGRASAELLARSGYRVFGTSLNSITAVPGVTMLPLNVQSTASINACVESVMAQAGRIDILVNNAGVIGAGSASEETDLDRARALFEINFFGIVQMTNTVLPIMRCQQGGKIINISSTVGLIGATPFFAFYSASKHALEAYTEGLRYEVKPFNIHVAMIEPGYTSTAIGETIGEPDHPLPQYLDARCRVSRLDRIGIRYGTPPEVVARTILKVARQRHPALRNLTGTDSRSIVLANRILPYPLFERLIEWMYLTWNPPDPAGGIPAPRELGLRRFLFHRPTRNHTILAAFAAGITLLAAGIGAVLFRRR